MVVAVTLGVWFYCMRIVGFECVKVVCSTSFIVCGLNDADGAGTTSLL
jgi:hypothetical protein